MLITLAFYMLSQSLAYSFRRLETVKTSLRTAKLSLSLPHNNLTLS